MLVELPCIVWYYTYITPTSLYVFVANGAQFPSYDIILIILLIILIIIIVRTTIMIIIFNQNNIVHHQSSILM
jgi:hypothetical protein